jgi:flagellar protein FliJ
MKFRFDTILRLRERERDDAAGRVQQALQAEAILRERHQQLIDHSRQLDRERAVRLAGQVSIPTILGLQRFQMQIDRQAAHVADQLQQVRLHLANCRDQLQTHQQRVRAIELLKERNWLKERLKRESQQQAELDQWAQSNYRPTLPAASAISPTPHTPDGAPT